VKANTPAGSEAQTVSPTTLESAVAGRVNAVMAYSLSEAPEQYKQYLCALAEVVQVPYPGFCSSTLKLKAPVQAISVSA